MRRPASSLRVSCLHVLDDLALSAQLVREQLARLVSPIPTAVAEFGQDPNTIRIAAWDSGPIYEWDPRISTAVDFACEVAGRDLTEAEWHQTFGDRPYQETCPSS